MPKYTEEQIKMIEDLKIYVENYGVPKVKDFKSKNSLRSFGYYNKLFETSGLKEILKLIDVDINVKRNISDEELLHELREYNRKIGFPTTRVFKNENGLHNSETYRIRFGSFKEAIIRAGIDIPNDKKNYFDRDFFTDEEIKKKVKEIADEYITKTNRLPTCKEVYMQKNAPDKSIINRRFGGLYNLYNILGYNVSYFKNLIEDSFKENLLSEYNRLAEKLNRTPTSRDLDEYSILNECCSASTYIRHFGNIYDVQILAGCVPVNIGLKKNKKDLIEDLHKLHNELGRLPCQRDIHDNKRIASVKRYTNSFGTFSNALKEAGFKDVSNKRVIMSHGCNLCLSSYEYDFVCMLEYYNFCFKKEEKYKCYIKDLKREYQFDFTIFYDNDVYFIEIFGMMDRKNYKKIANTKINICKNNNINLIDLYPSDFKGKSMNDLYDRLIFEISNIKCKKVII